MIDNFSILLTHVLMMLIAWKLISRADLDRDPEIEKNTKRGQ